MNGYPTEYNTYQPMFWQSAFSAIIGVAMMIALGTWALSTVRKALKGEDVEFPL
ncbi:hypothetical protein Dform_01725 [Dehalogenimonas formicexedens]|uniref:Uncharacterized protein n=1 Tax=Dehalogenimonas formicexedens TaxID=1839801 RepID=A0A1P8F9A4_9CHLR|nr:cytosine permease [Dehalogenimonas formicexedens]APV45044.1 hypothetical protein Dform_01725 [Dehalogenimonas formicexedens]